MNDNRATLQALQDELAALPPPRTRASRRNPALALQHDQRIAALGAALQGRLAWDRILREISSVLPGRRLADHALRAVAARRPPPPAPTTHDVEHATTTTTTTTTHADAGAGPGAHRPRPLTLGGYTYSQEGVARLLSRLAVVPALQNVKLVSSTQATVVGRDVVSFAIQADSRAPGDRMSKLPTPAKIGSWSRPDRGRARRRLVHRDRAEALRGDQAERADRRHARRRSTAAQRAAGPPTQAPPIRVADLFKLSRAMPDTADIPGVLLQLSHVAAETGVTFQSITPHDPVPLGAYQQIGIDLDLRGPLLRPVRLPLPPAQPRRRPRRRAGRDRPPLLGQLDRLRPGRSSSSRR